VYRPLSAHWTNIRIRSTIAAVKLSSNPYSVLLRQASDRFFLNAVWLGDDLLKDSSATMYRLSATPQAFGTPKPCSDAATRQKRLNLLLTACRAFFIAERKASTHAMHQRNLRLTGRGV
jgi:hypothetical protein